MKLVLIACIASACALYLADGRMQNVKVLSNDPVVATFSIVGYDPETGDLGVAVQSRFFGVGSVVPWAKAGVGAIATQAFANTTYGPQGLELLEKGLSAQDVVKKMTEKDTGRDFRQVGIVDAKGRAAAFTGEKAQKWRGHITGANYTCQGNILAGEEVVKRMSNAFKFSKGPLAERMLAALKGAQSAGGDKRGKQSAALLVVRKNGGYAGWNDRYVDICVEDHKEPIKELERLLKMHRKFYSNVPVPGGEKGKPAPEGEGSPKAVFQAWKSGLISGDFKGVYELYYGKYRKDHPEEEFVASCKQAHQNIKRNLEVMEYVKAFVDGNRAMVYFRHIGSNRPNTMEMVKEDDKWRIIEK